MEFPAFSFCALALLLATAGLPTTTLAVATPSGGGVGIPVVRGIDSSCTKPYVRKEWRRLTVDERKSYIGAVKCMMGKPGITPQDAVTSRYEDFVITHINQTFESHSVGIFYPYHRFLVARFEQELWDCGWNPDLGQPYWDWTLDTGSDEDFFNSPIFDVETGFGGNGEYVPGNFTNPAPGMIVQTPFDVPDRTGGGCLEDGPFAGLSTLLGPQNDTTGRNGRHCIRRDFSPFSLRNMSGPARVAEALAQPDYGYWELVTDTTTLHPGGHWGAGGLYGTMTDLWSSPSDPLFWLHHGNVDRAWWSWQSRDPARVYDISGPLVIFDWTNEIAGNVTLDSTVWNGLGDFRKETTVEQVMNIRMGILCYAYDELY